MPAQRPRGVIFDTCVLFSSVLRDTLFRVAPQCNYDVRWSSGIIRELRRVLPRETNMSHAQVEHLITEMTGHFAAGRVTGYESLIPSMTCDKDDRHVVAAAAKSDSLIITANLKHFPPESVEPLGIDVMHPDEFLLYLLASNRDAVLGKLQAQANFNRKPPNTVPDVLNALDQDDVTKFVEAVRKELGIKPKPDRRLSYDHASCVVTMRVPQARRPGPRLVSSSRRLSCRHQARLQKHHLTAALRST